MYVVRISGHRRGTKKLCFSKPCRRCESQLKLLGFKKIHYIDDISQECKKLSFSSSPKTKTSWGLHNLRLQTSQVARTYSSSRCVSPT